jgi:hypothetical protein
MAMASQLCLLLSQKAAAAHFLHDLNFGSFKKGNILQMLHPILVVTLTGKFLTYRK